MAGETTQALRDKVRERLGKASEYGFTDDALYSYLTEAQRAIIAMLPDAALPGATATATGNLTASEAALPSDFWRERLVLVGDDEIEAKPWSVAEADLLNYLTPSATNPYYFIFYSATAGGVRLIVQQGDPSSTAAYKVLYVKVPPALSDTVDPVLSSAYHEAMVDFAVMRCREARTEWAEADRLLTQFQRCMAAVASRYVPGLEHDIRPGD